MTAEQTTVRVGVGVFIRREKNGPVVFGRRLAAHGKGEWSIPGGHLELGESFAEAAVREAKEETNLDISTPVFRCVLNQIFTNGKHYVTVLMEGVAVGGTLENMEPDKCEGWEWIDENEIKNYEPLFTPMAAWSKSPDSPFIDIVRTEALA